ncbi:MAG: tRNA pseudouridine(55) synthase, partial [bacterium]
MSDTTKENKSRRNLKGIILIDKPEGISSFGVVRKVKRILNVRRAGHLGTLDPFATGLLPILLGSATKLFPFLSKLNKRYIGLIELGKRT